MEVEDFPTSPDVIPAHVRICPICGVRMLARRYIPHTLKCRERNQESFSEMFVCPYNALHIVPVLEKTEHLEICPSKVQIDQEVPKRHGNLCFPARTRLPASTDTPWFDQIQPEDYAENVRSSSVSAETYQSSHVKSETPPSTASMMSSYVIDDSNSVSNTTLPQTSTHLISEFPRIKPVVIVDSDVDSSSFCSEDGSNGSSGYERNPQLPQRRTRGVLGQFPFLCHSASRRKKKYSTQELQQHLLRLSRGRGKARMAS